MRNGVLALLVVVVCASAASAEAWAEKMFKDGPAHNFGSVPHGSQLFHRFTVTNVYEVPLKITAVRSSCICGTVTASTETIEPTKTGWVDVNMDARKFTGEKKIVIYVTVGNGDDYNSTAELKISATGRTDIVFNPGSVAFGNVAAGETPTQTIDVEYAGNLAWKVTDVVTGNSPVEASFKEMYRKPGQVGYQISVKLKSEASAGPLKQELFLKTNDPASPLVPLVVEANLQASLGVNPDKVSLSNVQVGEENLRRVVVRGSKEFKIKEIDGLGDGIELEKPLPTEAEKRHTLTFKCKFEKEGDIKRKLKIKTDMTEKPLVVTVEGNVIP
ncbi:MAG TPA: DUF1573 domain-containing protein [Gemmataceae bacterium]